MQEQYGIAAFRSRQQVMRMEAALRRSGVRAQVVSTPKDVSIGCGLSVRFDLRDAEKAQAVYRAVRPGNLIGFYQVAQSKGYRPQITPMR